MDHLAITSYVASLTLSHSGTRVLWDGAIGSITMSDVATGQKVCELPGQDRAGGLAITADYRRVASVGSDRIVRIWDTGSGALLLSLLNGANGEWIAW
jgi:WD40 repeat protein